jgi:DNA-binding NtrC family response regulator
MEKSIWVKERGMSQSNNQPEKGGVPSKDTACDPVQIYDGNETILFVDDEIYLAEVGREMLEDYGYRVDTMTSSRQAFELFEKNQDRYDLLITDYTMPEMTGNQLVEKIHLLRPQLPVLMCTGIELPPELFEQISVSKILMKPFGMEELIQGVREVLDSSNR